MRKLLLAALACCALFSSCKTYQLNVVSSVDKTPDAQTGDYQFDNDTVRITYSFYGENAPVSISIYNKLNQPLYVDWQKSALIIGDRATSYATNSVVFNGDINTASYKYRNTYNNGITTNPTYTTGTINGTADLPKTTTFLPPHAESNNTGIYLTKGFLQIPDNEFLKTRMRSADATSDHLISVKSANFTPTCTPLAFRSYITMYTLVDNKPVPVVHEQHFFISRSIKTSRNPNTLTDYSRQRGDYFINSKASGASNAIGIAAGAIAVGAFVAFASQDAKLP
ncbi:hypothetical protein ACFQZX_18280 [Mucilaginibacter litoreus]|uniref:Lipoprotein n=1 Tax=Mucilaginibacter litoreus TaxID=1048221 RepID=A0ABW3AYF6_9SPHI